MSEHELSVSTDLLGTSYTTSSTAQQKTLTLADLDRMAQVLLDIPPEPIGEWMREQGCPPEQWRVVMPKAILEQVEGPMFWPSYVAFSDALDNPVFIHRGLSAWDFTHNVYLRGCALLRSPA